MFSKSVEPYTEKVVNSHIMRDKEIKQCVRK